MTVLHILDHSVPIMSGYSSRSRAIVSFQRKLDLCPVVLTSGKQGSLENGVEQHDGIRHYRTVLTADRGICGARFVRELLLMGRLLRRIAEVARTESVQVLHAHSPILNGLPALLAGQRLGLPVVYEARAFWEDAAVDHGTYRRRSVRYAIVRRLETFLLKHVGAAVTICEGMRNDLMARGVPASRLYVVPNGVDTEWFYPMERDRGLAKHLGIDGGPVFGFVGSFYHYEGLRFLLESTPELVRRLPGARILLVGGGAEEAELRAVARQLGNTVVMPGVVPHGEIRKIYAAIDVFVCPRRRTRLTELVTPLKPLEAMSMARPVLGSNVGGLAELIRPDVTGLLFDADSQEAFVRQAVRAGEDEALRQRLGRMARAHLVQDRSWERIVAGYREIYARLMHSKGCTP